MEEVNDDEDSYKNSVASSVGAYGSRIVGEGQRSNESSLHTHREGSVLALEGFYSPQLTRKTARKHPTTCDWAEGIIRASTRLFEATHEGAEQLLHYGGGHVEMKLA